MYHIHIVQPQNACTCLDHLNEAAAEEEEEATVLEEYEASVPFFIIMRIIFLSKTNTSAFLYKYTHLYDTYIKLIQGGEV
jgi:hypothetical protein